MEEQVEKCHRGEDELVLDLGVVGITHLDERYKRCLSQNVEAAPFDIMPVGFPIIPQLHPPRREVLLEPHKINQKHQRTHHEVERNGDHYGSQASLEVLVEKSVLGWE